MHISRKCWLLPRFSGSAGFTLLMRAQPANGGSLGMSALPDTNYGNARGQRPHLEHSSSSVRMLTDPDTGSSQQQDAASDTESLPGEREDVESEKVDNCDIGKEQDKDMVLFHNKVRGSSSLSLSLCLSCSSHGDIASICPAWHHWHSVCQHNGYRHLSEGIIAQGGVWKECLVLLLNIAARHDLHEAHTHLL